MNDVEKTTALPEALGEDVSMTIKVKAAFPLEWGKEYYTVDSTVKQVRAACVCCDNTGEVTIKGTEYECPRCHGKWQDKEVVSQLRRQVGTDKHNGNAAWTDGVL